MKFRFLLAALFCFALAHSADASMWKSGSPIYHSPIEQILFRGGFTTSGASGVSDLFKPGPSTTLYNNPYYQCAVTYYVNIATGSDSRTSTQAQSASTPWLTLQKATNTITGPACFSVASSATHYHGVQMINGGNVASRTGYAVFRCDTLDGCTIDGNAGVNGTAAIAAGYCSSNSFGTYTCPANTTLPDYFIFDGFVLAGPGASGALSAGFWCTGTPVTTIGPHHCWLLNSIVSNFGESGFAALANEYWYAIHNTLFNNSGVTCGGAQGSNIGVNSGATVSGYTPVTDDQSGAAPYFGFPTWVVGSDFFHTVIAYNVIYNANNATCGTPESDHNGIIWDSFSGASNPFGNYNSPQLGYGNVIYNNGGGGAHIFNAENIYVANNSVYNNGIMPSWGAFQIDDNPQGGIINTKASALYNNIAVGCTTATSVIGSPSTNGNDAIVLFPQGVSDIDLNNITFFVQTSASICSYTGFGTSVGTPSQWLYGHAQTAPGATNHTQTDPKWVSVSTASPGTQTTQPASTNFALQPTSPAIGFGTVQPWMPATATDAGACPSSFNPCP